MVLPGANKDPMAVRMAVGVSALIASGMLLYVSARMNYRFGYSLGTTPEDGELYGMFSASADILKVAMPFVGLWAWRQGLRAVFWGALVVWCVCALYGWMGAAGHLSKNRMETTGQRTLMADNYKDLRSDLARVQKEMEWLPATRAADAVKADMQGLKAKIEWTRSGECSPEQIAGKGQREFCQQFFRLNAELGNAVKRDQYETQIRDIGVKLSKVDKGVAAASQADPQAGTLSHLTGDRLSVETVKVILVLLGIAALEIGGGLGPFASLAYIFGVSLKRQEKLDEIAAAEAAALAAANAPPSPDMLFPDEPKRALPKPNELRPVIPAEWRELLNLMSFPPPGWAPPKDEYGKPILRPQDDKSVLGWKMFLWLCATGNVGEIEAARMPDLYLAFAKEDFREPRAYRWVAEELEKVRWATKSGSPVLWTIVAPSVAKLREALEKRKELWSKIAPDAEPQMPTGGKATPTPVPQQEPAKEPPKPNGIKALALRRFFKASDQPENDGTLLN